MPQRGRMKTLLQATIDKKIAEVIHQIWKNESPKGISKSLVIETVLKYGLKDKEAIIKELQRLNTHQQ